MHSTAHRPPTITDTVILGKYSRPECGVRCLLAVRSHLFQKLKCDPPRLWGVHDSWGEPHGVGQIVWSMQRALRKSLHATEQTHESMQGAFGKSLHATEQTHKSIHSPPQCADHSDSSRLCCA